MTSPSNCFAQDRIRPAARSQKHGRPNTPSALAVLYRSRNTVCRIYGWNNWRMISKLILEIFLMTACSFCKPSRGETSTILAISRIAHLLITKVAGNARYGPQCKLTILAFVWRQMPSDLLAHLQWQPHCRTAPRHIRRPCDNPDRLPA